MAKYCLEGSRLHTLVGSSNSNLRYKTNKVVRIANPSREDQRALRDLKAKVKEAQKLYDSHAKGCKVCP